MFFDFAFSSNGGVFLFPPDPASFIILEYDFLARD